MPNRFSFLSLLLLMPMMLHAHRHAKPDSLLLVLDKEIKISDTYIATRQAKIDSLKAKFYRENGPVETALEIGNLYAPYRCDSALAWYQWAERHTTDPLPPVANTLYEKCKCHMDGKPASHLTPIVENPLHQEAMDAALEALDRLAKGDTSQTTLDLLAKSAIADIRSGVTDNNSSWLLALVLYERGDINRAYDYIEYSCLNSDIYNSKYRYVQIGPIAHGIAKTYRTSLWRTLKLLGWSIILCLVVIVGLITLSIYSVRKNRQLHRLNSILKETKHQLEESNHELSEMNRTREQYICAFLEEQSAAIKRAYKDNLKAGKPDAEEKYNKQIEQYYLNSDTIFLRLYPHFVERFNSLLRLDAQIETKPGQLTPELRIFALIRLGLDKSTRIAELLCLSPNTVYNYRSRVKNMAQGDREKFEEAVRAL